MTRAVPRAGLLVLACAAHSLAQLTPPTDRVRTCTTAGCHAPIVDHRVLHGPAAVGACDVCHEYADPAKHTFLLKREGREQCDFCHIDKVGTELPVVHEPVAKGECLKCHNPHGATDRRLLRMPTLTQTCLACHADTLKGAHVHDPAAKDRCTDCHAPHTAAHPGLLPMPKRDLCLSCHAAVGDQVKASAHPHQPAQGDCTECHSAHASDHIAQLKSDPRVLCSSCHQEQEQIAMNAAFKHPIVLDGRACLNCHLPHGSDRKGLLPADPVSACLACHAEQIKNPDGTVKVVGVSEVAEDDHFMHGPIRGGDCRACHIAHGAAHADLLIAPYSPAFYQPFSEEAYGLCFACHDRALATAETTDSVTGFRDGLRNLHYLHVNKTPNGRSCRSCHATHAAPTASLVAETVSFGQWRMPLNFVKTDTGGSCAPGCHQAVTYTRPAEPRPPPARDPRAAAPAPKPPG